MPTVGCKQLMFAAGLLAFAACSLLAPSDESLLGGKSLDDASLGGVDVASESAAGGSDARTDVEHDAQESDVSMTDATDHFVPTDAAGDGADAEAGADASRSCKDAGRCGRGSYCSRLGRCEPCGDLTSLDDLSELEFAAPEALGVLNDAAGGTSLRYPRAFDSMTRLTYQREVFGASSIWLTPDLMQTPGAPLASPIDAQGSNETAALKVERAGGKLSAFNFFFGKQVEYGGQQYVELFGASIDVGGFAPAVTRLPAPFNTDPTLLQHATTLALAQTRALWVRNLGGINTQIVTARLDNPAPVLVPIIDANGCEIREIDFSPWLTPDGRLLFINMRQRDADCKTDGNYPNDIFVVKLDASGQADGPALPLRGITKPGTIELDGSLSTDLCWLYFAAGPALGDPLRLYRAQRVR